MNNINEYLGGRIFNVTSLNDEDVRELQALGSKVYPATFKKGEKLFCRRCMMEIKQLPIDFQYCRQCINLGKIQGADKLLITSTNVRYPVRDNYLHWDG